MKTGYLIIFTGILAGTGMMMAFDDDFKYAYGMWFPLSPEDLIEQSKTIFVGTVIDVTPVDVEYQSSIARDGTKKESVGPEVMTLEEYTVEVEEFLKNPRDSDTMKVLRATVGGVPSGPSKISGFDIGDRVLFYLPKEEKQTHFPGQYLPESFNIPKECDAKSVLEKPRIDGRNQFSIMQEGVQREDNFTANIPIQFRYESDGGTLSGHSFNVSVGINKVTDNSIKNIFQKTIQVNSELCEWISSANWDFVPQPGQYSMAVHISEDGSGSGFSRSFSVKETTDTPSVPNKEGRTPLKLDDLASELWYDHDYIIDGTILDIRGYDKPERVYDIQINSFFKPTEGTGTKIITVYGSPNFYNEKGDRGIFFIKKEDARWKFGEYGAKATENCTPELMYHNPSLIDPPLYHGGPARPLDFTYALDCYPHYYKKYLPEYLKAHGKPVFSPLTQQIVGVPPNEVVCNEGLELIIKHNGRGACVKTETIPKLIERGWAKIEKNLDNTTSFSFCGSDGLDSEGNPHKSNSTHHWNENECEWTVYSEEYLKLPICDPNPEHDFGKCRELPQHAMNPDSFLKVIDVGYKSSMELELTSFEAYEDWQKSRGPTAKKVPILNIGDHNIHPLVLQMVNSMWDLEGYQLSRYNDKLHVKEIDLGSTEIDHQSIYDWLDKTHAEQYGVTEDASFSNHFTFRENLYKLSWAVAD